MRNVINIVYLALYVCVTLIQYAHPPVVNQLPYAYVWAIAAFAYPLGLGFANARTGFWKGMLTILLISVVAQTFECGLYLLRTSGFKNYDSVTVVLFAFYLIGPLATSIVWYPLGYLASWLLFRRRMAQISIPRPGD